MPAILNAMNSIKDKTIPVEIYSDSQYVIKTLNGDYSIRANRELWDRLMKERNRFSDIKFLWVKGHDKNQHNIEVDKLAFGEAQAAFFENKGKLI